MNNQYCFPRQRRLLKKADFQTVFDCPYKVSQQGLLALFRVNHQPVSRLGVIIGKRIVKKAVTRNQFKRIIRESFRHHQNILQNLDIIVIAKSSNQLDKIILRKGIDKLWVKLIQHYQNLSL